MIDDDGIREMLKRLSRRHESGGRVIERAAIAAEGADLGSVLRWIVAHDGRPEAAAPVPAGGGLHGGRVHGGGTADVGAPRRYVLPPGVLS
jgi:hypothetical protein